MIKSNNIIVFIKIILKEHHYFSRFIKFIIFLILSFNFIGCHPKPMTPIIPNNDEYGCVQPPSSIFTSAGIDLHFAESTFGKIVIGDLDISTNPQIISLATKAVNDYRIKSYLRCLAIKRDGYTQHQAAYLEELSAFMSTKPTSNEFISWQKTNPFPIIKNDKKNTLHSSKHINKIISRNNSYYTSVIATGTASCGKLSLDDCKKQAYMRALENAAQQGAEIFLKSDITLVNSKIVEDKVNAITTAKIIYHEIIKKGMDGESGYSYTIFAYLERAFVPVAQSNISPIQYKKNHSKQIERIKDINSDVNDIQDIPEIPNNEKLNVFELREKHEPDLTRWKFDNDN